MSGSRRTNPRQHHTRGFDLGRWVARGLCVVFAVVGMVPLLAGLMIRSDPLQRWAASETSRILRQHLGVAASFDVEMSAIPLRVAVRNLEVPASDGGTPALSTGLASVRPRFFSLLAGRIDVGDIEIEDSALRLVVRDGKVTNVDYRFPKTPEGQRPELTRSPFRSLAVTNSRVELDIDGTYVRTGSIDVDAFAQANLAFDVALRAEGAIVDRVRQTKSGPAYDEDQLCALDLRVFASKETETVTIRRLSILGGADLDPARGTRPACRDMTDDDTRTVAVRLSQFKVDLSELPVPRLRGRVMARGPAALANRLELPQQFHGWAGFSGEFAYDGTTKLPEVDGKVRGADIGMGQYTFAHTMQGTARLTGDVVQIPELDVEYGNGATQIARVRIEPFGKGLPISVGEIRSQGVDFPGLMRDVGITERTIVDWNFGDTLVENVRGTLTPFYIDGAVAARTHDFVVWNRAYYDPTRKRMIGVKQADIQGRFRVHSEALEFYETDATFGNSHLRADLVSIGFKNSLTVNLADGAIIDLSDISPIANLEVAGVAELSVDMAGPAKHPVLEGKLSVDDLMMGGFEAGDIGEAEVRFEPLFVDFMNVQGRKDEMTYRMPSARLDFEGAAPVEFTAAVASDRFVIRRFFEIFEFDEDPRFDDIAGSGSTQARVRYVLGGPEDTCDTGRLRVDGDAHLDQASLFGESYSEASGAFSFEWFDMQAGAQGMRLFVPTVTLRKGTGSVFGSAEVWPGGRLDGTFVATRLPVSKIDALGDLVQAADGFVTGAGHLGGTLDEMSFTANVHVTEVVAGDSALPPSHLALRLEPTNYTPEVTGELTGCGRAIRAEFDPAAYARDESGGTYYVNGELFGGQIKLEEVSMSRQRQAVMTGRASLNRLDLGALSAFVPTADGSRPLPRGSLSGAVELTQFFPSQPFSSRATVEVSQAEIEAAGFQVRLAEQGARLVMGDGQLKSENLALAAKTPGGQGGILDVDLSLDGRQNIDADLVLRETTLGILTPALSGLRRADGRLAAAMHVSGTLTSPQLTGRVVVQEGELGFEGIRTPITDLELVVDLKGNRLVVSRGDASWGGGTVTVTGTAPLQGTSLGQVELRARTRGVSLPLSPDIRVSFDSDLGLTVPVANEGSRALPRLSGTVDLLSATYEKPMTVTADIASLAARGNKSDVDAYDEQDDAVEFDVVIRSTRPIQVSNNLVDTELSIDPAGLRITGTNQRPGAVGTVEIPAGGLILLRQSEFEIQRGLVRFSDPTQMRPEVDVTAVTDFRRYEDRGGSNATTTATSSSGAPVAGNWRIVLHAYGPPDDLQIELSSDPPLAQDDIFLLLAVGLTRTELEQTQNSGAGSSVALEALGSLSGAESAVTENVPIDEFRFGSTWSSRTGRTEPTVTIGKRLSDRIRASVTTSLSDANEVRSNVEYRATDNLSVEGSYDNAQASGTTAVGNIGGDVRWRVEFE